MLANHDTSRSAPLDQDGRREKTSRPRRAKGFELAVLTLGAAYAVMTLEAWRRDGGTGTKKLADVVNANFAMLGVSFDASGRPLLPSIALEVRDIKHLHGRAAKAAYLAVAQAVRTINKACNPNDFDFVDLDISAFFDAFNEGAYVGESVRIGGRSVKREAHAVDCATGECLGHHSL